MACIASALTARLPYLQFAEPPLYQAAALLSGYDSRQQGGGRPSQNQNYQQGPPSYGKPQPAPPRQPQQGGYGSGSGGQYGGGDGGYGGGRGGGRGGGYGGEPGDPSRRYNQGMMSPPPQNYGSGPPPAGLSHNRPPTDSRPPRTPAPPQGADPTLFPLFKAVDKEGTGQLTEKELRAALVNGDWSSFDPHTVRMMISGLWGFLSAWRALFDRFDEDASGNISYDEYSKALIAFGYRLSPQFVNMMFRSYDKRGK
ncbi:hypothetical protein FGG08_001617 [Glutinoglossum americanum]|uniref:EF-hand domain-containing protein n=1 Tax=Glutinoglossum americanum TaxID=1670608 RepID=A0A9P8L650_9PEZI|nr:hypothetical protein FGG08_001617 [Glutinoglossum americanum]